MATKMRDFHSRLMARHSDLFDTYLKISYTIGTTIKAYNIKCTVASISDEEKSSGKWDASTIDFTLTYDNIKLAEELKTKKKDCILSGFKCKNINYDGTTYRVESERPNGSTLDCVVLRGVVYNA